jgi:hypothetical protein
MTDIGIIGFLLIVANIAFSYKGFTNSLFFDGYKFEVDRILIDKDYRRILIPVAHIKQTNLLVLFHQYFFKK